METYRICLREGTMVGTKVINFDHWVSVKAKTEQEAKKKSLHKLAYQMLNGDSEGKLSEPIFVFNRTPLKTIRYYIDPCDLEIYK